MNDFIERQAAIDLILEDKIGNKSLEIFSALGIAYQAITVNMACDRHIQGIQKLPSAQPEPLTDKEQRIFLAAMGREEKVCEEVDGNYVREPYEDSLMRVCKEIRRKVKDTLWT